MLTFFAVIAGVVFLVYIFTSLTYLQLRRKIWKVNARPDRCALTNIAKKSEHLKECLECHSLVVPNLFYTRRRRIVLGCLPTRRFRTSVCAGCVAHLEARRRLLWRIQPLIVCMLLLFTLWALSLLLPSKELRLIADGIAACCLLLGVAVPAMFEGFLYLRWRLQTHVSKALSCVDWKKKWGHRRGGSFASSREERENLLPSRNGQDDKDRDRAGVKDSEIWPKSPIEKKTGGSESVVSVGSTQSGLATIPLSNGYD
jgi:hypothetical protein